METGEVGAAVDETVRWVFAGTASVVMHVGILALMISFHTAREPQTLPDRDVVDVKSDEKTTQQAESEIRSAVSAAPAGDVHSEVRPEPRVDRRPEPLSAVPAPEPRPVPKQATPVSDEDPTESYVVKKGDTLSAIAKAHDSSIYELARLNRTTKEKLANLRVGQRIKVPKAGAR